MPPITNIFVLMLENHSFDHIFAMSGIPGIRAATVRDCNYYALSTYCVQDGAPASMTTDPGHEFEDVVQQLCGCNQTYTPGKAYPAIDNSGFACNYATSISENTGKPAPDHIGDIMACFNTPMQLPVIYELACEFALCDNWSSSMPGPTWPNRFFMHGASSAGLDRSPNFGEEVEWLSFDGFRYEHGSIFDALKNAGHQWRLYNDYYNRYSDQPSSWEDGGWISQAASLKNIHLRDVHPLDSSTGSSPRADLFAADLQKSYPYPYTFIEPNFGRSFGTPLTYKGGSSQHPEDDPHGGEGLIKAVYEAIRNSPLWNTSLLVITYDEHGGFYDSVKPLPATPPGDAMMDHLKGTTNGFDFSLYGVRVPAVIVSPLIPKGTVDHTLYDHSSILATLERLLHMNPLTNRDASANDLRGLLTEPQPREDCPLVLPSPSPSIMDKQIPTEAMTAEMSEQPIPASGNTIGFLHVLLKGELTGADGNAQAGILQRFRSMTTVGDARAYIGRMRAQIESARQRAG